MIDAMPKEQKQQKNRLVFMSAIGLIIILVGAFFLFQNNNQYGTLLIKTSESDLSIFVDNQEIIPLQKTNPVFKLKKGEHSVIISKIGHWPWAKNIEIIRKEEVGLKPFFVPQNTSGFLIGESDIEYASILTLFQENLILPEVFGQLTANANLKSKITALDFYKDRADVVIFSAENGVFVLEMEEDNIQNLQPLYSGNNPVFVKKDNDAIYILDGNNLLLVNY